MSSYKKVKYIFDSSKRYQCSNNDPVYYIPNVGIKPKFMYVNRINIPHTFYNIQAHIQPNYNNIGNNLIEWVDSLGQTNITYLDEGNYSLSELLTHMGSKMTAAASDSLTYTCSVNNITKKITITNNTAAVFQIKWQSSSIQLNGRSPCQELGKMLGFTSSETCTDFFGDNNNLSDLTGLGSYTATNNYWIGFPRNLYLFSDIVHKTNKYNSVSFYSSKNGVNENIKDGKNNILLTLPVNTNYGENIEFNTNEGDREYLEFGPNTSITTIKFELLNDIFDPIDLRGQPWFIEIVFLI